MTAITIAIKDPFQPSPAARKSASHGLFFCGDFPYTIRLIDTPPCDCYHKQNPEKVTG